MMAERKPCPSVAHAVLGAVAPEGAMLRCGNVAGHFGRHRFEMEWSDEPPTSTEAVKR